MSGIDPSGLEEFEDTPLVRALRAPGTTAELAGEERVLAAYRRSVVRRGAGRAAGRVGLGGLGGAVLLATVTLSSGVAAAAYTQVLPAPVQSIAHDAFGHIGVPAAPVRTPEARPRPSTLAPEPAQAPGTGVPVPGDDAARPGPTGPGGTPDRGDRSDEAPSVAPTEPSAAPTESADGTGVAPGGVEGATGLPTTTPSPGSPDSSDSSGSPGSPGSPSPDGTASPAPAPAGPAASLTSTASRRVVSAGGRVNVLGVVRDAARVPVVGQEVALLKRRTGGAWTVAARAESDAAGRVWFSTGALRENTWLRLRLVAPASAGAPADASGVVLRTEPRRVVVRPVLAVRVAGGRLQVRASGARAGEAVTVLRRTQGSLVRLGTARLDGTGAATFDVSGLRGRARVVLRLPRTSLHGAARASVLVRGPRPAPPPGQTPAPAPSPSPSPAPETEDTPGGSASDDAVEAPAGTADRSTTTGS